MLSIALFALLAGAGANPLALPQAVTANVSPTASPPPGCTPSASGSYGIAVQNMSASPTAAKRQVSQLNDGQAQAKTVASVSVHSDGQVQVGVHTMVMMAAQIGDGQVQAQTTTYAPVSVISDGQPQAPSLPAATTAAPVVQATDAQPEAPSTTSQAPATTDAPTSPSTDRGVTMAACQSDDTLAITLADGVLTDAKGRTGYIASNFQFQFDAPPQAGAIYTSGFTFCGNGTLALGGSNVFYECQSGDFYNLYDRSWAPQCLPVIINILRLVDCP
ncbi:MAG: hypothetical protein Q9218_006258 [Villophora microphyllina]